MFKGRNDKLLFYVVPRFKDDKATQKYLNDTKLPCIFMATDREKATDYLNRNHPTQADKLTLELQK